MDGNQKYKLCGGKYGYENVQQTYVFEGCKYYRRVLEKRNGTDQEGSDSLSVGSAERQGSGCRAQLLYAQL